jgi:hypothetical protein
MRSFVKILPAIALILSGCQIKGNTVITTPVMTSTNNAIVQAPTPVSTVSNSTGLEPYNFRVSDPGFVTLKGYLLVFDPSTTLPDPNDAIFLVPLPGGDESVITIPPFKVGEVPQADVDERTGDFVFTNIQPGRFAIVVLTMGQAQMPARFIDSKSLAILNISEADIDRTIELDYIGIP